jgi:NAD(P)-dependent dehydrogenase (short-subunit alcohol dehydrogenase family)
MKAARNGKIINLSSSAGMRGFATVSAYCVAKFGVRALTQVLALELAEYNINVNALAPGIVRTPLWEFILDTQSERGGEPREQIFKDRVTEAIPLNRPQEPEDIANLVMFLSSDISRNITGETININGGQILG